MDTRQNRFLPIVKKPKPKPSVIVKANSKQIYWAVTQNLSDLKLSKLSPGSIKHEANRISKLHREREWSRIDKSRHRTGKGREVVKSAILPTRFWAEKRTSRKWNWDTIKEGSIQ